MEAKDTVINLGDTDNKSLKIMMEKILLQQAEISFKAGERKVAKWVIEHYDNGLFLDEWKAQLKKLEQLK